MKIVAVCGFGVGSSLLLKMSIDKVLKQLNIDEEATNSDIVSAKGMNCDAIFTSFEMAEDLRESVNVPVYPIKQYMNLNEVKVSVEKFLKEYNK